MVRKEDKACRASGTECVTKVWRLIRRQTLLLLLSVIIAGTCLAVKDAQALTSACAVSW